MKDQPVQIHSPAQDAEEDEITLIDLFAVLLRYKILIITITALAAAGSAVFSIISAALPPEKSPFPDKYTFQTLSLIDDNSATQNSVVSMPSSSGLWSIASLANYSFSGKRTSYRALAETLAESNGFFDAIIDQFAAGSLEEDTEQARQTIRKRLKNAFAIEFDAPSSTLSLSFTHTDPIAARDILNFATGWLGERITSLEFETNKQQKENLEISIHNIYEGLVSLQDQSVQLENAIYGKGPSPSVSETEELSRIRLELEAQTEVYKQVKAQYELVKVQMAAKSSIFQILEQATLSNAGSSMGRGLLCIIVTLAAAFLSVFLAFLLNAVQNIRHDPEAIAKLTGKKKPACS